MRFPWLVVRAAVLVALTAACAAAAPASTSTPAATAEAVTTSAPSPSPTPTSSTLVLHVLADFQPNSQGGTLKWSPGTLSAPAGEPFQIAMKIPNDSIHNLYIEDANQVALFKGPDQAHGTTNYDIPALEAGTYFFVCTYHRKLMTGTLTVK